MFCVIGSKLQIFFVQMRVITKALSRICILIYMSLVLYYSARNTKNLDQNFLVALYSVEHWCRFVEPRKDVVKSKSKRTSQIKLNSIKYWTNADAGMPAFTTMEEFEIAKSLVLKVNIYWWFHDKQWFWIWLIIMADKDREEWCTLFVETCDVLKLNFKCVGLDQRCHIK